jgi:Arc/MetJ-type ribon-helix-helix transcriptional regulator
MDSKGEQERSIEVGIPKPLYDQLEGSVSDTGFGSVEEFVQTLLQVLVSGSRGGEKQEQSDDQETIRKRLKLLGYI